MAARVMVVDDSPTIRKVVASILSRGGHDPVVAADGKEALELLGRERVDLMLLDFVMPKMTGYELCRRIRSDEKISSLPVVLMSAKAEKVRDQFLEQTGALDAISKPFDPQALLAVVEGTLKRVEEGRVRREIPTLEVDLDEIAEDEPSFSEPPPPASRPDLSALAFVEKVSVAVCGALSAMGMPVDKDRLSAQLSAAIDPAALTDMLKSLEEWSESAGPIEVLRGRGDAVPLGEILQVLQMQMQSGTLTVSQGDVEVDMAFRQGLVDIARSRGELRDEFRLGRYLVEEGLVTKDELEQAAGRAKAAGRLLGDELLSSDKVKKSDLDGALARQSSELIYEILRWPKARFAFRKGGAGVADNPGLGLPVASLVMEGFQRVDEWRVIEEHIDFDAVLYKNPPAIEKLKDGKLGKVERKILDLVDGERTVREIMKLSSASSFDACKILYQLLEARLVRRMQPAT